MSVDPKPLTPDPETRLLMIVDDEPELLRALLAIFERHYMVVYAESGDKAMELLHQGFAPQVILSDNRMPGISGIEFLAESTKFVPDAIRVVMTGFTDIRDVLAAINHGHVYMYLTKPWQVAEILQSIRICFHHYQVSTYNKRLLVEMQQKHELMKKLNDELYKTNKKLEEVNHLVYSDLLSAATTLGALIGSQQRYYYTNKTTNHSTNGARIARHLGEALGIKGDKLTLLEIAALLRDIGEVDLPPRIQASKPHLLTGPDRELFESHVERGAELLRRIERFSKVAEIVEQHHERIDGTGFPRKLNSFQVMKEAQIVGIIDLYHDLVYRMDAESYAKARSRDDESFVLPIEELASRHEEAGKYIRNLENKFDPEILRTFLALADSGKCPELKF